MEKTIFALGFFDGVHIGHRALLESCRRLAEENRCQAGAVTFGAHPDALVLGAAPLLINTPADRERLLHGFVSRVVTLPFDRKMQTTPWQDFLETLCRDYGAAGFVCGDDFRFGDAGAGDPQKLAAFADARGLPWAVVPQQECHGVRVSSTYIRDCLMRGEMAEAVRFLGHPHLLTGTVVPGKQLGRTLGIPTANLLLPEQLIIPRFGVYACRAHTENGAYAAVTNIGTRPTVAGRGITVESWLLDYSGDLYGRTLTLEFYTFLRPEQSFPSLEALTCEIRRNADETRSFLAGREGTL